MDIRKIIKEEIEKIQFLDIPQEYKDEIQKRIDNEVTQKENTLKDLRGEVNRINDFFNNIDDLKSKNALDDSYVDELIKDFEGKKSKLEFYISNWEKDTDEIIANRITKNFLDSKKYEEDLKNRRESRKFGKDDIVNLFVDALEGGSNYWYDIKNVPKEVEYNVKYNTESLSEAIGRYILDGGSIQFFDIENDEDELGIVDMDSILDAIQLMKRDYLDSWNNILNEAYDSDDADIFLQLCVMGDVVFG